MGCLCCCSGHVSARSARNAEALRSHVQEFDRMHGASCWSLRYEAAECAEVNANSPRSQLVLHAPHFASDHP